MRNFDNRNSWLDHDGLPLIGRLRFCKLHTTVPENIYDKDGNVLANPVFTNTIGQTVHQVFLQDNTDYTIYFEKYTGVADMTTDENNWYFEYSMDDLWDVFGVDINADAMQMVDNIAQLRNTAPETVSERDNRYIVTLGGYNTVGDKPQVMYIWDPDSIESDNGGNVIKVESISTGRWVMVNQFGPDGIDVRHFGVFGSATRQLAPATMPLYIGVASAYAESVGLPLFFPAIDGVTFYRIDNQNLAGAIFARETKVFGATGTSARITMYDEDAFLDVASTTDYKGAYTIAGSTVKTSWGQNSVYVTYDPSYRLVVDSTIATANKSWSDITIDFVSEVIEWAFFNNCVLNSIGKLGDHTSYQHCRLTEIMFDGATDFSTITVYDDDIIELADWPTTSKWIALRGENTPGALDMQGRTLDSTCELGWTAAVTISNANFNGFIVRAPAVALTGCTGTVTFTAPMTYIRLDNCQLTYTTTDESGTPDIFITNGSIINLASVSAIANNFTCVNSTFNAGFSANAAVNIKDSTITGAVGAGSTFQAIGSDFGGYVNLTQPGTMGVVLLRNNFAYTVHFNPTQENTVVNARIEDNYSTATSNPFAISAYVDPVDSHHTYTYLRNGGTFPKNELVKSYNIYVDRVSVTSTLSGPVYSGYVDGAGHLGLFDDDVPSATKFRSVAWVTAVNNPWDTIDIFALGSTVKVDMTMLTVDRPAGWSGVGNTCLPYCGAVRFTATRNAYGKFELRVPSLPVSTTPYAPGSGYGNRYCMEFAGLDDVYFTSPSQYSLKYSVVR